jgi:hypothetical protein
LSKEIPYLWSKREGISEQILWMFLLSFMKAIKSGVETYLLFLTQSVKASLKISEIPLPSFWAMSFSIE